MGSKTERRRVSRDHVRSNAVAGAGGASVLKLPKGIREWLPDKAGTYTLDILPYEVSIDNHPDKVEKGALWYKYPAQVHRKVGVNEVRVCSPLTVGKADPLWEERQRLAKNYKENEDAIKPLTPQRMTAYNIIDPDDKTKVAVFFMSSFSFATPLAKELEAGGDDILNFYDVTEDGMTLTVRFSDEAFKTESGSGTFLKATRIDFKARKKMDEEKTLARVACLDKIFDVPTYEKLEQMWKGLDDDGDKEHGASGRVKGKDKPKGEDEDKDDDNDTDADDKKGGDNDDVKIKEGDRVSFKKKGKVITGVVTDVDDDEIEIKGDDGDEYDIDADEVTVLPPEEKKPTGKKKGTEKDDAPAADPTKVEVGDTVKDEDTGAEGVVTKIDEDDVSVEKKNGKTVILDIEDLEIVKKGADKSAGDEDEGGTKDAFAVGDKVTWDGGDESGVVVKVKPDKIKVKDEDDDEEWVPVGEVEHAKKSKK